MRTTSGPEPVRARGSLPRRSRSAPRPSHAGQSCPPVLRCRAGAAGRRLGMSRARRLRPVGPSVDSGVQIRRANLEVMAVILPPHAIDARSRLALEREVGFPELIAIDVVQERGEPFLLLQPCGLPYASQAVGRAFGSVSGACRPVARSPRPPPLAPRTPPPVARPRSLASLLLWRSLTPRPRASSASARRLPDADRSPPGLTRGSRSPGFRSRSLRTCQGLRPRRTGKRARVDAHPRFAFRW